eukprot:GEMP01108995.1.p1 GENE.GEMP01108995.1~~GEMP01108995.1.p1  ORF type:complete len:116 (-),score=5.39 GEMP01108995.1:155-502(-)
MWEGRCGDKNVHIFVPLVDNRKNGTFSVRVRVAAWYTFVFLKVDDTHTHAPEKKHIFNNPCTFGIKHTDYFHNKNTNWNQAHTPTLENQALFKASRKIKIHTQKRIRFFVQETLH